jgi:hypothetical protein
MHRRRAPLAGRAPPVTAGGRAEGLHPGQNGALAHLADTATTR